MPIKFQTQNPNTISKHIFAIQPSPKPSLNILPLGGDTPFYRVRLRNQRFLPHPQKNWSPLRTVCTYLYINYSVFKIIYACVRVVAPGTVCPGAHFCVREICIITNNAAPIKFRTQNPNTIITPTHTVFCPEFSMRNA